jgi:serine/threonine protein kinase
MQPKSIDRVFWEAGQLKGAAERNAYLDRTCAGDADLRRRVEQLLQAKPKAESFLESPAIGMAVTVEEPITERPGTVIGPYKLLEQIGEGGFGIVFMAEQQQPVRRKVALKILKPGMDTRQVIARFEAERQALALMDHPHIAQVFDGGETPTGRPYFVMELVKGLPITDYCDQNRLPIRARVELFVSVCQAVQHAHQKGVIHRDMKPSNVLVTLHDGVPVVKVIDFGIAKATGQQLTEKTLFTAFAQLVGTPLYMSPEQAALSGLDVDTRSDIYSLGVLLYELLTGTTPFDKERLHQAGYEEICRIIREEEPPKPSTRISTLGQATTTVSANRKSDPKRLRQLFCGELDWIVMKALEKDRNRRYETASAFAADVLHYLHDEPVQACPPSAVYRLRKFARRHRGVLTIATVVAMALLVILIGQSVSLRLLQRANARTEEQRNLAEKNFRGALQAVDDYFTQISESTLLKSPLPGLQPLRKQLLETALTYYQEFAQQHRDDPALQADLARASFRVALIREELGAKADALQAYHDASHVWEKLLQDDPANPTYLHESAQCFSRLGSLQSRSADEGEKALASLQKGCTLAEAAAGSSPDQRTYQKTLARSYHQMGLWYREYESSQAPPLLGKALETWERLAQDEPELELQVAMLSKDLGYYHAMHGEPRDALAFHGRARDLVEKWARRKPSDFEIRRLLRYVYKNLGYVHDARTHDYEKAREYYGKVLELDEQFTRENPAVVEFPRLWAGDLWQTAALTYSATEDYAQTAELAGTALQHFERLDRVYPRDPEIQHGLRQTASLLSKAQVRAGHSDLALRSLERFRALLERLERDPAALAAESPFDHAQAYSDLGLVQQMTGRPVEALRSYQRAVELYRKILLDSPEHQLALGNLAEAYCGQGVLQRRAGQFTDAMQSLQAVRALLPKLSCPDGCDHFNEAVACAQLTLLVSEPAEKRELTEAAVAALRRALAAGFTRRTELKTNPDLDPVRSHKDFPELLAAAGKKR